jgi:hypothetical protein
VEGLLLIAQKKCFVFLFERSRKNDRWASCREFSSDSKTKKRCFFSQKKNKNTFEREIEASLTQSRE